MYIIALNYSWSDVNGYMCTTTSTLALLYVYIVCVQYFVRTHMIYVAVFVWCHHTTVWYRATYSYLDTPRACYMLHMCYCY
jgi:hypothetical protein